MTDLASKLAENIEEASEAYHQALLQKQYGHCTDIASSLRDLAAAHRDVKDEE